MAATRSLLRVTRDVSKSLRAFSTTAPAADIATATAAPDHRRRPQDHTFLKPSAFIGSWSTPKNPKEAEAKLAYLRRDYAKQVKELRKQYSLEMEQLRLEKQRKDDAKREATRLANEERKKLKAEAAKVRAEERKLAEAEFRKTLLKERAEKLEMWRMEENKRKEIKAKKIGLLKQQTSVWIDESQLERKIMEACVDTTPL